MENELARERKLEGRRTNVNIRPNRNVSERGRKESVRKGRMEEGRERKRERRRGKEDTTSTSEIIGSNVREKKKIVLDSDIYRKEIVRDL